MQPFLWHWHGQAQKRTKFNELQKAAKVAPAARFTPRKMSAMMAGSCGLPTARSPGIQPVWSLAWQIKEERNQSLESDWKWS